MAQLRRFLHSKLHRLTVTQANLDYEGSIALDQSLLKASGILPGEAVWVWNVTNGNRFETYTIAAPIDSKMVSINGAAARLVDVGDIVIVAAFCFLNSHEATTHQPVAVFVNSDNTIKEIRDENVV